MKLLVAEDEPETATYLQQGLSEAGFSVDRVMTGTDALQQALGEAYDLLIHSKPRFGRSRVSAMWTLAERSR